MLEVAGGQAAHLMPFMSLGRESGLDVLLVGGCRPAAADEREGRAVAHEHLSRIR